MSTACAVEVMRQAPIPTWFGVGGGADRLARPGSVEDVKRCLEMDPGARVLGDGANLLVADEGVGELVIDLKTPGLSGWEIDDASGRVLARGGANLPKLITETVRRGLGGLEGLGGIPATVGGAAIMNAGGAFGEIGAAVTRVFGVDRAGAEVVLERAAIPFGYRHSGLGGIVVTAVEFGLRREDAAALRERLKDVMAYKKRSQPMADASAGCCFKNPTLAAEVSELGEHGLAGKRVSAGMLIDRAGLKGLRVGAAEVSPVHGNFLVPREGATAGDVIRLMVEVERRVLERFGVLLAREVVVWERGGEGSR